MIHLEKVSDRFDKLEIHKPKFNRHRELLKDYSRMLIQNVNIREWKMEMMKIAKHNQVKCSVREKAGFIPFIEISLLIFLPG